MQDFLDQLAKLAGPASPQTVGRIIKSPNPSYADNIYRVLMQRIRQFEDELDSEHEAAIKLSSFGQSITLAVEAIEYSNPSLLVFRGYIEGQPATLIQDSSQLNFLLCAVRKADPEKPTRRIGFALPSED